MPVEVAYRGPEETPTRQDVDRMPGPVLVEFGTADCGFCRALAPRLAALLASHPDVRHVKVEDGPGRPLGRSFQVRLWPSLVFLRDGRVVRQLARPGYEQLEEALRAVVSSAEPERAPGG